MSLERIAEGISSMEIRGAGRIARSAAQAMKEVAEGTSNRDYQGLRDEFLAAARTLLDTRPTAVSLRNALYYTLKEMEKTTDGKAFHASVVKNAADFIDASDEAVKTIAKYGANLIPKDATILTHCNSTASLLAIIHAFKHHGKKVKVYADETRPRHQGHITAKQLLDNGVPVSLIVDSAANTYMKDVDIVIVGADTITASGCLINKVGTSQVALSAREHNVPFVVCAESYKFSIETLAGIETIIEERDASEVLEPGKIPGLKVRNPSFDLTPARFIHAIVTEAGVIHPAGAIDIINSLKGELPFGILE